ncbi:DUF7218 family protein [Algoriphagus vanfongensis]|uniref:DUF7218 family protein n=1 Tax=Algoriphagus vanfongensis TaxID=426371 RepID=UPI00041AABF6
MTKNHGPSIKNDEQYEALREQGMSKQKAARIANDPNSGKKGGKLNSTKIAARSSCMTKPRKLESKAEAK